MFAFRNTRNSKKETSKEAIDTESSFEESECTILNSDCQNQGSHPEKEPTQLDVIKSLSLVHTKLDGFTNKFENLEERTSTVEKKTSF